MPLRTETHPIVITGFMASGKTAVAEELARVLECSFVDLDDWIVQRHQQSIGELIQTLGEPSFRAIETECLTRILESEPPGVIALGGGTWTLSHNRDLIRVANCSSVWLDVPFEICWRRIITSDVSRPLAPNQTAAAARYDERKELYRLADCHVAVIEDETPAEIALRIASLPRVIRHLARPGTPDPGSN